MSDDLDRIMVFRTMARVASRSATWTSEILNADRRNRKFSRDAAQRFVDDVLAAYGLPAIRLRDEVMPPDPEPAADPDETTEPDPGDPGEGTEPPEQDPTEGDGEDDQGPEDVREMLRTARRAAARLR